MKNLLSAIAVLSLIFFSQSCDEEFEPQQQPIRIGFTVSSEDGMMAALPQGSRVVINIESMDGEVVSESGQADFVHDGDRYLLKPFSLFAGTYRITDFAIVDDANEMRYAVPRNASRLARTVPQPLDFRFSVPPDHTLVNMNFHLLDVRHNRPQDFGYPSFHFLRSSLLMIVTAEGSRKPISAKAAVVDGDRTIREYSLRASTNRISLPSAITKEYKLMIFRDGYATTEYNLIDLLEAHPLGIVKVALLPAFTMLAFVEQDLPFEFDLGAVGGGSISINWGDGMVESHALQPQSANDRVSHLYSESGNHPITITGDLDHITFFSSAYGLSMMDAVNFQHLNNLREITIVLTRSPRMVDLRSNKMLQQVSIGGVDVEELFLPRFHKITLLGLGPMPISADGVDALIDNIYMNVRRHNLTSGQLTLRASWEDEEALLGPPSRSSMMKLRTIRNDYGWILFPDPFASGV